MSIAVVILTFNEEKNIVQAIESAKLVTEEILIVDSGSTDKTVQLAEQNGVRVVFQQFEDDFSRQRNFALDNTKANWLLHIDADERISTELAENIKKAVTTNTEKVYSFRRSNILFGKKFKYGVFRPDKVKRLFPRNGGVWQGKVHESLKSDLPEADLTGQMVHYPYETWEQYFVKFNKYTSLWAGDAHKKGKRTSMAGALLHAIFSFVKVAFINLGILDGLFGIVMCCFHFAYTLAKYIKLYKLQD